MILNLLAIDFEFNTTRTPKPNLVSVSLRPYVVTETTAKATGAVESYWLHNGAETEKAKNAIKGFLSSGHVILSFGGVAEARPLHALGFKDFQMIDLHVLWRQLNHTCKRFIYGRYDAGSGFIKTSVEPQYDRATGSKLPRDNRQIGTSLAEVCVHTLGICIDTKRKTAMRDLIISAPASFLPQQRKEIMEYNESDIVHLPKIFIKLMESFCELTGIDFETAVKIMVQHGEYVRCMAEEEDTGIPVNVEWFLNLRNNYDFAKERLISTLVETGYPFYVRSKPDKENILGEWVQSYKAFEEFLVAKGLGGTWPRTAPTSRNEKGRYKMDDDTLEEYEGSCPELMLLRQTSKSVRHIGFFSGVEGRDILTNLGDDGRIRTWLAGFGTLTGRNAPQPSKGYIPAMAKWIRALINPPEGKVIIEFDWSSQEFAIAAMLSGDMNMLEAYESGDPYLYFGKAAGAIPKEGTKKTHPDMRTLFKSTVLGLQFGMGVSKLSIKLSGDMGRSVPVEEAQNLVDLHKRVFKRMWAWRKEITESYYGRNGVGGKQVSILMDGWCLLPDNDAQTSTCNFPVQGTGAAIFREAIRLCHKANLKVIYGLHDAIRIECWKEETEAKKALLLEMMDKAVRKYLPQGIRNEGKIVEHNIPFVEEGAEKMWENMKEYVLVNTLSCSDMEQKIDRYILTDS